MDAPCSTSRSATATLEPEQSHGAVIAVSFTLAPAGRKVACVGRLIFVLVMFQFAIAVVMLHLFPVSSRR
jgi:hypothetical protein